MKSAFNIIKPITAFLCVTAILINSGCGSADTGAKQSRVEVLKRVDKGALLSIVSNLSKNMSQNHSSVVEVMKLLKSYAVSYKINFTGNPKGINNGADFLSVYLLKSEKDSTKLFLSSIKLPSLLHNQITFNDLKSRLGDWERVPANARPMEAQYVITSFNYKAAPGISIIVESKNLPESNYNIINEIKLSPVL
jgi:hypothetical protein